jgi:hypothetical protein
MARSTKVTWGHVGEGFIRELDFGRVLLRLNHATGDDKDDIIGEWTESAKKFLEQTLVSHQPFHQKS